MAAKGPCYCFYHIQGDAAESASRPNAFRIPLKPGQKPCLQDVQNSFPLNGTGSFYFRFRVKAGEGFGYLDLPSSTALVPLLGGNVHAKVLRMDKLKCVAPKGAGLRLKPAASIGPTQSPQARSSSGSAPAKATSTQQSGAGVQIKTHSPRTPVSTFSSGAGAAPSPAAEDEVLVPPQHVDDDLKHMSVAVQIKIMKRREAEKQKHEAAVAAVAAADATAAQHAAEIDDARKRNKANVKAWGYDSAGEVRNIRALLSNLDKILWPEAKSSWKGVGMSALVDPKKVRIPYFKACRIVHPDKNESAPPDQQYIASEVFQALNKAWESFEKSELSG